MSKLNLALAHGYDRNRYEAFTNVHLWRGYQSDTDALIYYLKQICGYYGAAQKVPRHE